MLKQVLREIETAQGPITVRALSRKLGVEPNALEGMIQFWVRKGRIQDDDATLSCNEEIEGLQHILLRNYGLRLYRQNAQNLLDPFSRCGADTPREVMMVLGRILQHIQVLVVLRKIS